MGTPLTAPEVWGLVPYRSDGLLKPHSSALVKACVAHGLGLAALKAQWRLFARAAHLADGANSPLSKESAAIVCGAYRFPGRTGCKAAGEEDEALSWAPWFFRRASEVISSFAPSSLRSSPSAEWCTTSSASSSSQGARAPSLGAGGWPPASSKLYNAAASASASCGQGQGSSGWGVEALQLTLQELGRKGTILTHVAIWRQPIFEGVVDHHTLVYEYYIGRRLMSLKIDWCQDGLYFRDSTEDPSLNGDVVVRKYCRITPDIVHWQLTHVEDWPYDLVSWNCQHFCWHLFDSDLVPEVFMGGSGFCPGA
mmetsp:Transcript_121717/g.351408  ORF Transcript_121717/g.351408 Transcript_121717/m.351408 type:complete len:310 (+) Transcript_121717:140-1069(+)